MKTIKPDIDVFLLNNKNKNQMKVITPGHRYELDNFEDKSNQGQTIQFIEKKPKEQGSTELLTVNDGTTNEDLLEVLLDRLRFLNKKAPCMENQLAIYRLDEALFWLNKRTENRKNRGVEGTNKK